MAESTLPASETPTSNILDNNNLNESDSEFLSALDQVFATPSFINNDLEILNNITKTESPKVTTETTNKPIQLNNETEELINNTTIPNPQTTIIEKNKNSPPLSSTNDPPRIETFLHTPSIKLSVELPTTEKNTTPEELYVPKLEPNKPVPIITNTTQSPHSIKTSIPEKWHTMTLWIAITSFTITGTTIWQINELYEHIFRLETMNKSLESQLLETLTRIDLIKNNFVAIEHILRQLEPTKQIPTSTITLTKP